MGSADEVKDESVKPETVQDDPENSQEVPGSDPEEKSGESVEASAAGDQALEEPEEVDPLAEGSL